MSKKRTKTIIMIFWVMLFFIFLSLFVFYSVIRPSRVISDVTPRDFGQNFNRIQFTTVDDVLIKGWFVPARKKNRSAIILLHGYPADKGNILPSRIFLNSDYNLLFMDFRYLGESGGSYSTVGKQEVLDLNAAIQFLKQRGVTKIGIWGLSMGAAVALMAAPEHPEIKAIVAEAPYARLDWMADDHYPLPGFNYLIGGLLRVWARVILNMSISEVQPVKVVEKINVPLLIIFSKADKVVSFKHALLYKEAIRNHQNIKLIILEKEGHGELMKNYQSLIKNFFINHLSQ